MRYSVLILAVFAFVAFADLGDILNQFDAPGGNPDGLTYLDGYLWITSDVEFEIYQIDPSDGTVMQTMDGYGGTALTGLTTDETYLYSCSPDWIYTREIPSGTLIDSIPTPAANGEGLAWDGTYLWHCSFSSNEVYKLDPANGDVLDSFLPNGAAGTTGLVYDGYYLWGSFQNNGLVYKMIPGDPIPVDFFLTPCEVAQDLAWDGETLWMTEYEATGAQVYQFDPGPIGFEHMTWGGLKSGLQ